MENEEESRSLSNEKIFKIFSSFMARITKFEELVDVGNRYLIGFQHGLEFLRRPPIDTTSEIIDRVLKANMTRRLTSYIQAGCLNPHDSIQNMNKSKSVMKELQCLIDDATEVVQASIHDLPCLQDKDSDFDLNILASGCNRSKNGKRDAYLFKSAFFSKLGITDYAVLMAFIYGMIKQDYEMQERIVSSLSLKSSSGELESYCQMWSLRPFIDDEIMQRAWELLPGH